MPKQVLSCTINGENVEVLVQPYVTLLDALREDLGLTGPKSLEEEIAELRASEKVDAELEAMKAALKRKGD